MIYELVDTAKGTSLFEGWSETLIWSCLQRVMGKIYVYITNEQMNDKKFLKLAAG